MFKFNSFNFFFKHELSSNLSPSKIICSSTVHLFIFNKFKLIHELLNYLIYSIYKVFLKKQKNHTNYYLFNYC
jgi:hypothetical protein